MFIRHRHMNAKGGVAHCAPARFVDRDDCSFAETVEAPIRRTCAVTELAEIIFGEDFPIAGNRRQATLLVVAVESEPAECQAM
jgi:hypothetical protein